MTCDSSLVFSGPLVSFTNKTDRFDIAEILKVALTTITLESYTVHMVVRGKELHFIFRLSPFPSPFISWGFFHWSLIQKCN